MLYVDGASVATGEVGGEVSNWDQGLRLALGNELTEDRPWLGELHRVAIYARALDAEEMQPLCQGRPPGSAGGPGRAV